MVSLEQIKLLESKVSRTIDYVKTVTDENRQLKERLDSYQKRIGELEALVLQFKQDQSRIEEGILSALDRLNQFEDALESKLSTESKPSTEKELSPDGFSSTEGKMPGENKPAGENNSSGRTYAAEPAKPAQGKKDIREEKKAPELPAADELPHDEEKNQEDAGGELDIF